MRSRLKEAIGLIVGRNPDRKAVEFIVTEGHRMAVAYLRQKARRGRLQTERFGLPIEDLALDCIAEMFQRSADGRFEQLNTYFESVAWQELNERDLRVALRRLVFSKVNDGLFRRYQEIDSGLAKTIRNVKLAAKASPDVTVARRGRELWIVAGNAGSIDKKPLAPPEVLESFLISSIDNSVQLGVFVNSFARFVEQNPYYSNAFPMAGFAQIVRSALTHVGAIQATIDQEPVFFPEEIKRAIGSVTQRIKNDLYGTYVAQNKVDSVTYNAYFKAARSFLLSQYVSTPQPVTTCYDALLPLMDDLTKDAYRNKHRHVLEYIIKISRSRLLQYLKN